MKYKFFGKNITPDCSYCSFASFEDGNTACQRARVIKDGKCRSFSYDPLLRVPTSISVSGNYTAEDFRI